MWIALYTHVAAVKSFLGFVHRACTLYPHPADREVASSPLRVTPPQGHGQRAAPPASTRGGSHSTSLATHRDCGPRLALPPNLHLGKAGLYGPPRSLGTISNRLRAARLPQARENSIARTRVPFRTRRISISDPRCGNQSNQPAGADALRAKVNAAGSHPRIKRGSDAK